MNGVEIEVRRTLDFWDRVTGAIAATAIIFAILLAIYRDLKKRRKPRVRGRPIEIDKETFDPTSPDELL